MSCVSGVVWVIQQGICSTWNSLSSLKFSVKISFLNFSISGQKAKRGGGSSPNWTSHREKSMERPLIRQGVPVLNLPTAKPSWRRFSLSSELASAMRPPGRLFSPTCNRPRKNVPAVTTILFAAILKPRSVSTPITLPSLTRTFATVACFRSRFSVPSKTAFIRN
jgi:hypothetical protein